jgi:hypothetical protein
MVGSPLFSLSLLTNINYLNAKPQRVCSPTVRIIAFQAIDPGSTPGRRIYFSTLYSFNFLRCFSLNLEFYILSPLKFIFILIHIGNAVHQNRVPFQGSKVPHRVGLLLLLLLLKISFWTYFSTLYSFNFCIYFLHSTLLIFYDVFR